MLAASPLAKGLFTGAISESGGTSAPDRSTLERRRREYGLARHGGEQWSRLSVEARRIFHRRCAQEIRGRYIERHRLPAWAVHGPSSTATCCPTISTSSMRPASTMTRPFSSAATPTRARFSFQRPPPRRSRPAYRAGYGDYADKILAAYPVGTDAECAALGPRSVPRFHFRLAAPGPGPAAVPARAKAKSSSTISATARLIPTRRSSRIGARPTAGRLSFVFGNFTAAMPATAQRTRRCRTKFLLTG